MELKPELLLNEYMTLGEGPQWDENEQALYWVDTDGMSIQKYSMEDVKRETYQLDQKVGVAIKESSETLICALEDGIYRFNTRTMDKELIASPERDKPMNIFNDGKCDINGNFWIGSVHREELANEGSLFCVKPDYSCKLVIGDITISNGMAWSHDNKTMYYIDSPTRHVYAMDFDQEQCMVSNCRVAIEFADDQGIPDGMTIDVDGNVWVALWGGYGVYKCNPDTGEILDYIELPVSNVTSCAFGGKEMDTLFITTAKAELTKEELAQQPLAGGIFSVKTDTKGFYSNKFGISTKSY